MMKHKSKILVWKKAGAGILSFVLAFVLTTSLGMLPFVFGQSNSGSNSNQVSVQSNLAKTVVKIVSPEGGAILNPGQNIGVSLNITGSQPNTGSKIVDMMLVLDATGSMTELDSSGITKWQGLKNSVSSLIRLFKQYNHGGNLRLGAIVFNSDIGTQTFVDSQGNNFTTDYDKIYNASNLCKSNNNFLDCIKPNGGTNIGDALKETTAIFANFKSNDPTRYSQSQKFAVLVSDGIHNIGIDPTNKTVLDPFITNSIGIYTIGYGQLLYNVPDNMKGVDINIKVKQLLWCDPAQGGPGGIYEPNQNGLVYCLAHDKLNPPSNQNVDPNGGAFGNRLNALAIKTNAEAYYGSTVDKITSFFAAIFHSNVGTTSAIEILENFDPSFSLQSNNIQVSAGAISLNPKNSIDEVATGSGSYFVSSTDNLLHIVISPNTISDNDILTINFSFRSPPNKSDNVCIDTGGSKVIWGDINASNDPQVITGGTDTSLAERCYKVLSQGQGDVYFQDPFNLNFSANLVVLGGPFSNINGSLATLLGYGFKPKTQSQKAQFKNELESIINYLVKEQPQNVMVLSTGTPVDLISPAYWGKMIVAQNRDINVTGINGDSSVVAIVAEGGNITFDNVGEFHGVAIALPTNADNGKIIVNAGQFNLQGSLVANSIESSATFSLKSFNKSNYLTQIPGLAPLLNKIYSFYASE